MIILVLPAYNEAGSVGPLLTRCQADLDEAGVEFRVVLVNDGSRDGTVAEARRGLPGDRLEVLDRAENRGLAYTLRQGLARALERAAPRDVIVTMDADDSHPPGLIKAMLARVREGHDVVIASRFCPGAQVIGLSPGRRLTGWAASLVYRLALPIPGVSDYTCGYRAFLAAALRAAWGDDGAALFTETGFTAPADLLLKLRGRGLVFGEVPLVLRYDRKQSSSKMDVGGNTRATLALIARRLLGRQD